jgi:hypothetical protein
MRTTENVLLKIEEVILTWGSDRQAKADNLKPILNEKRTFDNLKDGLCCCLFVRKMSLAPTFMTSSDEVLLKHASTSLLARRVHIRRCYKEPINDEYRGLTLYFHLIIVWYFVW